MLAIATPNNLFFNRHIVSKTMLVMKLTLILLLSVCLQVSAKGYAQKVSLSEKNAPLENVFREINRQTGFTFIYTDLLLQKANKVSINITDASLEQALDICFKYQPFTYKIMNTMVVLKEKEKLVQVLKAEVYQEAAIFRLRVRL